MVKLVDAMGTKYIYATFMTKLTAFLRENAGATIDLADARLTTGCMSAIYAATRTCQNTFVDTMNAERDRILKHNCEVAVLNQQVDNESNLRTLPIPRTKEDIGKYLAEDYSAYYWRLARADKINLLWGILLQARRPDVRLYTLGYLDKIFTTLHEYYSQQYYVGSPVWWINGTGLDLMENPDIQFCTSKICCPAEFGQENLFENPKWKRPLALMADAYIQLINPRGYKIKEFLQGG